MGLSHADALFHPFWPLGGWRQQYWEKHCPDGKHASCWRVSRRSRARTHPLYIPKPRASARGDRRAPCAIHTPPKNIIFTPLFTPLKYVYQMDTEHASAPTRSSGALAAPPQRARCCASLRALARPPVLACKVGVVRVHHILLYVYLRYRL